jgi:xylulokinase
MPNPGPGTLLGIDLGSTRIKAVLVDASGVERRAAAGPTPFAARAEGVEMTVDELLAGVAAVLAELGPERRATAAVGVAGMAECGAPLDAAGCPLGSVIAWFDPRGEAVVERLRRDGGEALAASTGRRLRTVSSVAKLGWWVERTGRSPGGWLGVPELCVHALGGAAVTDPSLASRTGWYDVGARAYMPEVAAAIGVPVSALPPVVAAGSVAGRVTAAGAAWSGLAAGIPVTPAGHDHLAAAAGCGAGPADLVDSVGTAESLVRRLPGGDPPAPDTLRRAVELETAVSARPDGDGWALLGRGPRAGPVLAAVAAALGGLTLEELDTAAVEGGQAAGVAELVDAVLAGAAPTLPDLPAGVLWGALLDELARRAAVAAGRCAQLAGPAERALVVGGGARSLPWMRAKARHLAIPLWRAGAAEGAARGAAVAAGVAAGWWPSAAAAPPPALEPVSGGGWAPGGATPRGPRPSPAR